jgi:hypothetical protein
VQKIAYVSLSQTLIIIYDDANIDLLKSNSTYNIPFLKEFDRVTNKEINAINIVGNIAYVSTGFGIIVIDTENNEIKDTFIFKSSGNEVSVNQAIINSNDIYALTKNGFYHGNLNDNLLDFSNWNKDSFKSNLNFTSGYSINNNVFGVVQDSLFNLKTKQSVQLEPNGEIKHTYLKSNSLILVSTTDLYEYDQEYNLTNKIKINTNGIVGVSKLNQKYYVANNFDPLIEYKLNGELVNIIRTNGPFDEAIFDIDIRDGKLWAISGGHNFSYGNTNTYVRIYNYSDGSWKNYLQYAIPSLNGIFDGISVNINPKNTNQVYFGTWGNGLLEFNGSLPFNRYTEQNSSLNIWEARKDFVFTGVGETAFDENGNLWAVNPYNSNLLSVKTPEGSWKDFGFSDLISGESAAKDLVVHSSGSKWIALPRLNEIIVFDDNGTIDNPNDDERILIKQEVGQGNLPGIRGITMIEDLNGQIWVGTSDGIVVFYSPENIFDANQRDAERVLIDDGENVEALLQSVTVIDIQIDGNNRKWVATDGSGAYLLSENGKEEILHFTKENSPLLSNYVSSIAVDLETGEVYLATDQGLVSYRGNSTAGKEDFSEVKIFPNPIRPNYRGPIAISGLMDNTTVKITDINGTLVNEIVTEGGQAIWYGSNFNGERVSTGVYLVFNSAEDEEEDLKTQIGKILFVK